MNHEECNTPELNAAQSRIAKVDYAAANLDAVYANFYSFAQPSETQINKPEEMFTQNNQQQADVSEKNVANFAANEARKVVEQVYRQENNFPIPQDNNLAA